MYVRHHWTSAAGGMGDVAHRRPAGVVAKSSEGLANEDDGRYRGSFWSLWSVDVREESRDSTDCEYWNSNRSSLWTAEDKGETTLPRKIILYRRRLRASLQNFTRRTFSMRNGGLKQGCGAIRWAEEAQEK